MSNITNIAHYVGSRGCCGCTEIVGFPADYNIKGVVFDKQYTSNAVWTQDQIIEHLTAELTRIKKIANEHKQTFLMATTNTAQDFVAEWLRSVGFTSSPKMAKPLPKGRGFIQLHYLQLTEGEYTK